MGPLEWVPRLEEIRRSGREAVLATVTRVEGSAPREPGAKMIVVAGGDFVGTIGGGRLEELVLQEALAFLSKGERAARLVRFPLAARAGQCCGGLMEILLERVERAPALYLFGAGHVGTAVCRTLSGTPFRIHLVDPRPEWVDSDAIPPDVVRHAADWDSFAAEARWSEADVYVAIMTHRHDLDEEILQDVLRRRTRYVGLIGSRAKWARFRARLQQRGVAAAELARVHCPIGIDLGGGKSPQEVAISVAAELVRDLRAR
jgi:xanthine dehydrogenase accessory factor